MKQQIRNEESIKLSSLRPAHGTEETFLQLLSADGHIIDGTADSPDGPAVTAKTRRSVPVTVHLRGETEDIRILALPLANKRTLVVGASLAPVAEALEDFLQIAAFGGAAALVLAGAGGWLLARTALRPVERMRAEAAAVGASEPSRRLSPPVRDDEIGRLAGTLNEMLDRLESAMNRQRAFVAEASHDLRTPVAILKSEVELALQEGRSPEELRAAIQSAGEEADRLARLADDLLLLAQSSAGSSPADREPVDLPALVAESLRRFSQLAGRSGVRLQEMGSSAAVVRGSRQRLERTVENLIDNAIRHSPEGATVEVEVLSRDGETVIEVRDRGPGVPAGLRPRLFEPFQRGSTGYPGVGLGLAITRSIATEHGGEVRFEERAGGGSVFSLVLPDGGSAPGKGLSRR